MLQTSPLAGEVAAKRAGRPFDQTSKRCLDLILTRHTPFVSTARANQASCINYLYY
jgi:hypothetical protein